jgi:RNA polymerase sigma-70 factor (ECF subfamily)
METNEAHMAKTSDGPHQRRLTKEEIQQYSRELSSPDPRVSGHAWDMLHRALYPLSVWVAYRTVHNEAAAEEIASTAWGNLSAAGRYDAELGDFRPYLLKSVRNGAIDYIRRPRPVETVDFDDSAVRDRPSATPDTLDAVIEHETWEHVQHCLRQLTPQHLQLLTWHYLEEKTLKEIGLLLDIPNPPTVYARIQKALEALRKLLRRGGVHV